MDDKIGKVEVRSVKVEVGGGGGKNSLLNPMLALQ
jgi:hypothetical protein